MTSFWQPTAPQQAPAGAEPQPPPAVDEKPAESKPPPAPEMPADPASESMSEEEPEDEFE